MKRVLVIIVSYNGEKWIRKALSSINPDSGVEGIVIDNGSSDNTVSVIRKEFPDVKLIQTGKNIGFGAANNIGMRYAIEQNFDFIYLLNQDAWISSQDILNLVQLAEENPGFGILSPLHCNSTKDALDDGFYRASLNKAHLDSIILGKKPLAGLYPARDYIPAAHWLIKSDVIKKTGLFSPTFFYYGEDLNLIQRMEYYGYKCGYSPVITAVHDRENRSPSPHKTMLAIRAHSLILFSNPRRPFHKNLFCGLKNFILPFIKNPVLNFSTLFYLLFNIPAVYRNYKTSKTPGAFI